MNLSLRESLLGAALIALSLAFTPPVLAADESAEEEESGGFFDDIREGVSSLADDAAATVPDVPSGAVVAFNRDECPLGWSAFPPADGRVIIGLDSSGEMGPDQRLSIGETSIDAEDDPDETHMKASLPWLALLYCEKD